MSSLHAAEARILRQGRDGYLGRMGDCSAVEFQGIALPKAGALWLLTHPAASASVASQPKEALAQRPRCHWAG